MRMYSTREAAKKLGLTQPAISKYISAGKIPAPKMASSGGMTIHMWTEEDIERVRGLLPKIKNGRKTRYQKLREAKAKTKAKKQPKHK